MPLQMRGRGHRRQCTKSFEEGAQETVLARLGRAVGDGVQCFHVLQQRTAPAKHGIAQPSSAHGGSVARAAWPRQAVKDPRISMGPFNLRTLHTHVTPIPGLHKG